jgi:hypothetical protein
MNKRFPGWFQSAYSHGIGIDVVRHRGLGLGFARDFCNQIEQDIPIWEAKIHRDRPQLARGESAITEFRSWAAQSYEEADA